MRDKNYLNVLGLMSGTSLDGLDIALCRFEMGQNWVYKILESKTYKYQSEMITQLQNAKDMSGLDLMRFDRHYGHYLGEKVMEFLQEFSIKMPDVDFISSHGHTIFHDPEQRFTVQIGHGPSISASAKGLPVIYDFRSLDVAFGGQGAPLVPIGDQLLFTQYEFCLNLGGIANLSYEDENRSRIAFDICHVNMINNHIAQTYLGREYDENGQIARSGKLIPELFQELNLIQAFKAGGPKSYGREQFEKYLLPLIEKYSQAQKIEDILNTFVQFQAEQIAQSLLQAKLPNPKVLVTGGGAYNQYLLECITTLTQNGQVRIEVPDTKIVEFKEALVFAFLGVLRYLGRANSLQSVTGASMDSSTGSLVNFKQSLIPYY